MRSLEHLSLSGFDGHCAVDFKTLEYLSSIISAATLAPPGVIVDTAICCRRRPERKKCTGKIQLKLQENPAELKWWCPECSDNGVITNWKGTPRRIVHPVGDRGLNPEKCCKVVLSEQEFDLLNKISVINPKTARIVHGAVFDKDEISLLGVIDDWDSLMGYIAFEANHETRPRRRLALNKLFEKIKQTL